MKIYLYKGEKRSAPYMLNISRILEHSLRDIGHIVKSDEEFYSICDIALFVQRPFRRQKRKGVYHILYQVELWPVAEQHINLWYDFGWDEIWDSNKINKKGEYIPIGYHPCLKFKETSPIYRREIGLLGGANERRNIFRKKVKHPFEYMGGFDPILRDINISKTKINLNLHAYDYYTYVEWDRIGHFFANDCFFISEQFPCEIEVPMFKTPEEYDTLIEYYLNNPDLRKKEAEKMGFEFRENFDMRDLLRKVL